MDDEKAMRAALAAWNNNFLPACYPTMQGAYDAGLRIAIRAYLAARTETAQHEPNAADTSVNETATDGA